MMRFIVAAVAAIGAWAIPAGAQAAVEGYTTADVNMRAGPSTEYPRILVLPYGAPVVVYGCVRGYTWCDVAAYHERGWVSSRYLDIFYDDRRVYVPYQPRVEIPIITFDFGYWDTWYERYPDRYPWYRDYRWRREYPDTNWYVERRRGDDYDGRGRVFYPPREDRPGFRGDGERRVYRESAPRREGVPQSERRIIQNRVAPDRPGARVQAIEPRDSFQQRQVRRQQEGATERRIERQREVQQQRRERVDRGQQQRRERQQEFRPGNRSEGGERRRPNAGGGNGECVMRNGRCVVIQQ